MSVSNDRLSAERDLLLYSPRAHAYGYSAGSEMDQSQSC